MRFILLIIAIILSIICTSILYIISLINFILSVTVIISVILIVGLPLYITNQILKSASKDNLTSYNFQIYKILCFLSKIQISLFDKIKNTMHNIIGE